MSWGVPGGSLERPWGSLGAPWGVFGGSWGRLGRSLEPPGGVLGPPRAPLGRLGGHLRLHLEAYSPISFSERFRKLFLKHFGAIWEAKLEAKILQKRGTVVDFQGFRHFAFDLVSEAF